MKKSLTILALVCLPMLAEARVGLSINIGQPSYYGPIVVQGIAPPPLVYAQPVTVRPAGCAPVYLRVPAIQSQNWGSYCAGYGLCGSPVYFVQDSWYISTYSPWYLREHNRYYDGGVITQGRATSVRGNNAFVDRNRGFRDSATVRHANTVRERRNATVNVTHSGGNRAAVNAAPTARFSNNRGQFSGGGARANVVRGGDAGVRGGGSRGGDAGVRGGGRGGGAGARGGGGRDGGGGHQGRGHEH